MSSSKKNFCYQIISLAIVLGNLQASCFAEETNSTVQQSPYVGRKSPAEVIEIPAKRSSRKYSIKQLEQRMFERINQDRTANGASALKLNKELSELARELAEDQLRRNVLTHRTEDGLDVESRARKKGIKCLIYENLGIETGPESALDMLFDLEQSFMNESPDKANHRHVLLFPSHTCVGVGVAQSQDSVVLVQDFTIADPSAK